jgi:carbon monoxide dehydrogenase subunit G
VKLEQSFEVAAPIDEVWAALIDVERVAPCLPGAQITEAGEDGTYRGTFQVKLGPTTAAYNGELHMEFVDEDAHQVVMKASGQDKRGQGAARATITSRLVEADGSTRVDSVTDFTITGRLARFGRGGMIKDVSNRLFRDFSTCVSETITVAPAPAAEEAAPVSAGAAPDADTDESPALDVGPERSGGPASAATAAPAAAAPPPPSRPAPAPAAPVSGGSLILGVVGGRIQRFLRRVFGPLVGRPPR